MPERTSGEMARATPTHTARELAATTLTGPRGEQLEGLPLPPAACLFDEHGELREATVNLLLVEQVQAGNEDRRLDNGVGGTVKPRELPLLVFHHHAGLEPQPLGGVVYRYDLKLIGPTGVREHETARHHRRRPYRRLPGLPRHHPRQQEHVVAEMKHAGSRPEEVRGGLAARKGPQKERADTSHGPLVVVYTGPHRGHMRAAVSGGGRDQAFENHASAMID